MICFYPPPLMTCRGMFYFKVEQHGCCESASGQEDRMRVPYEITHDEGIAKRQVIGVSFFDVQEARMSRVHGCTGATLGTSFLDKQKKSFVHGCTYAAIAWMRRSSDLAGQRRNQDSRRIKISNIDWIPAQGWYDESISNLNRPLTLNSLMQIIHRRRPDINQCLDQRCQRNREKHTPEPP